jgi:hypothetical protein
MARGRSPSDWASFAGIVAVVAAPHVARADLSWRAPDECPNAADVRARIEHRLGDGVQSARAASGASIDASIDVERDGAGFVATIDTRDDAGRRTIVAAACDELADAVAVIVARDALDSPARDANALPAPVPAPPRARWWHVGVRVATIAGVCVVPNVGVAGEVAAFARVGPASLELGAARWLGNGVEVDRGTVQHFDVRLAAATARLGAGPASLPLRGWLVGELGTMVGTTTGMDGRRDGAGRWLAVGMGFGATWRTGPAIAIVTAAEAIDALARPSFQLADTTPIYAPPRLSARGWVGIEVAW